MTSNPKLRDDLKARPAPLRPIEKQLIAWGLGFGVLLLLVLGAVNHLLPTP
jgi:hypothetical protein